MFASQVAEHVLGGLGVPVLREDAELGEPEAPVASAVESLSAGPDALVLVYGYFFTKPVWIRVALFFSTIPVAIAANAGRVTFTGILSEIDPEYATGFFHTASGWVLFLVAFILLTIVHQFLEWLNRRLRGSRQASS
ncbi:MAG: archaeosortase/exosortase family protein [Bryobacterales bacterium]|nr:archaeosortase/exosortase family protein [Bryobacterales bacterium]